jgi:hypothetical protein
MSDTPPKEKERPAVSEPNALSEANATHSFSVKALRFLELELDENIVALLVAIALIVMSCNWTRNQMNYHRTFYETTW